MTSPNFDSLRASLLKLLTAASMFEVDAESVVDFALRAERWGFADEGCSLIADQLDLMDSGVIDPRGRPLPIIEVGSSLHLDGSCAPGQVAAHVAIDWLERKTLSSGIAQAVIKGSRDLGHPLIVVDELAQRGLACLCSTSLLRKKEALSRTAAAIPRPDQTPHYFDIDKTTPGWLSTLVTGLAIGHLPEVKIDAPNPHVCEHWIVAIQPESTTTLQRLETKTGETFASLATTIEEHENISLSDETRTRLTAHARKRQIEIALP